MGRLVGYVLQTGLFDKPAELSDKWLPNRVFLHLFNTYQFLRVATPVEFCARFEWKCAAQVAGECLRCLGGCMVGCRLLDGRISGRKGAVAVRGIFK